MEVLAAGWTAEQATTFWATIGASIVAIVALVTGILVARAERRHRDQGHFRDVRREVYIDFLQHLDRLRSMARPRRSHADDRLVQLQIASTSLFLVAPTRVKDAARDLWPKIEAWYESPWWQIDRRSQELDDELKNLRTAMTADITPPQARRRLRTPVFFPRADE